MLHFALASRHRGLQRRMNRQRERVGVPMKLEQYEKQRWMIDIVANCPRRAPLPDCPALDIRRLPMLKRIVKVERMSDRELSTILGCHGKCLAKRDNIRLARCRIPLCTAS